MNSKLGLCLPKYKSVIMCKRSFTLVEMFIVVAILVVLVTVLMKVASGIRESSRITDTQTRITILEDAVNAFREARGYLPLSVPYDAWLGKWYDFVKEVDWDGDADGDGDGVKIGDWKDYFFEDPGSGPEYSWVSSNPTRPTNIHMLIFQLIQVPESKSVIERFKQTYKIEYQVSFKSTGGKESWLKERNPCKLTHPLDNRLREVYQPQDPWGMPFRYWTKDVLDKWWGYSSGDIYNYFDKHCQGGFFIESAGVDSKFGWWVDSSAHYNSENAADNLFAE